MKRRLQNKLNIRSKSGFTLVELIVTLAVMAIVASIGGMSLIAWHNHSEYLKNTETAKTIYLAAQSALSEAESKGVLDETMKNLKTDSSFHPISKGDSNKAALLPADACEKDDEGNFHDYGYITIKRSTSSDAAQKELDITAIKSHVIYGFLSPYLQGEDVLTSGSYSIEFDMTSMKVYAVFYSGWTTEFQYEAGKTAANSSDHGVYYINTNTRDEASLSKCYVGYFSAAQVNNINLGDSDTSQFSLNKLALVNDETLHLDFGSNSSNQEKDTEYYIEFYENSGGTNTPLFSTVFSWNKYSGSNSRMVSLEVKAISGNTKVKSGTYSFPVTYNGTYFSIILDAMLSAPTAALKTMDLSINRLFTSNEPMNIAAYVQVLPNGANTDAISPDFSSSDHNTVIQNDLFATPSDSIISSYDSKVNTIRTIRHLYNIGQSKNDGTSQYSFTLSNDLDWSKNILYTLLTNSASNEVGILDSTKDEFPSIKELPGNYTLNGNDKSIKNLRLGSSSSVTYPQEVLDDLKTNSAVFTDQNTSKTIALFETVKGTITSLNFKGSVLNNTDTNAAPMTLSGGASTINRASYASTKISTCGIICGIDEGNLELISFSDNKDSAGNATPCSVTASLNSNGASASEGAGIGMAAGVINVTSETMLTDRIYIQGNINGTLADDTAVTQFTAGNVNLNSINSYAGVGSLCGYLYSKVNNLNGTNAITGVIGKDSVSVSDVTAMSLWPTDSAYQTVSIINASDVTGNRQTGGIIGTAYTDYGTAENLNASVSAPQVINCLNEGLIALAASPSSDTDELSNMEAATYSFTAVNGLFRGGIIGYTYRTAINSCVSKTSNTKTAGYIKADATVNDAAVQNDCIGFYTGGITGYSEQSGIYNCKTTGSGYVTGYAYVGGISGGISNTELSDDSNIYQASTDGTSSNIYAVKNESNVYGYSCVGGIAGILQSEIIGTDSCRIVNSSGIKVNSYHSTAGGIAGISGTSCTLQYGINSGTVSAETGSAGGIAGINQSGSSVSLSYLKDTTAVSAKSGTVGGIVGSNDGTISSCGDENAVQVADIIKKYLAAESTDGAFYNNTYYARNVLNIILRDNSGPENSEINDYETADYIAKLKQERSDTSDNISTEVTDTSAKVSALRGADENSTIKIELLDSDKKSYAVTTNGSIGGIAGENTTNGSVINCGTGKWYVHAFNISQGSFVGGITGQNSSTGSKNIEFDLNFSYVRRFVCSSDRNTEGSTSTASRDNENLEKYYAAGIVGSQKTSADIYGCINIGDVFDENTCNSGGIIGKWNNGGGTIDTCFNYGTLYTSWKLTDTQANSSNVNYVGSASGGIIADIRTDSDSQNISYLIKNCENHGAVNKPKYMASNNKQCAYYAGGILGSANIGNNTATVDVYNCLNGSDAAVYSSTVCGGVVGWIYWIKNSTDPKLTVSMDKCRNYSNNFYSRIKDDNNSVNRYYGSAGGIFGTVSNAVAASSIQLYVTIKNSFSVYYANVTDANKNFPITALASSKVKAQARQCLKDCTNNFYMDFSSFNAPMSAMTEVRTAESDSWTVPSSPVITETNDSIYDSKNSTKTLNPNTNAKRLYAGNDSDYSDTSNSASGNACGSGPFIAAYSSTYKLAGLTNASAWLDKDANAVVENIYANDKSDQQIGDIDFWYKNKTKSNTNLDALDISDEAVLEFLDSYIDVKVTKNEKDYTGTITDFVSKESYSYTVQDLVFAVEKGKSFQYTTGSYKNYSNCSAEYPISDKSWTINLDSKLTPDWGTYDYYVVEKISDGTRTAYSVAVSAIQKEVQPKFAFFQNAYDGYWYIRLLNVSEFEDNGVNNFNIKIGNTTIPFILDSSKNATNLSYDYSTNEYIHYLGTLSQTPNIITPLTGCAYIGYFPNWWAIPQWYSIPYFYLPSRGLGLSDVTVEIQKYNSVTEQYDSGISYDCGQVYIPSYCGYYKNGTSGIYIDENSTNIYYDQATSTFTTQFSYATDYDCDTEKNNVAENYKARFRVELVGYQDNGNYKNGVVLNYKDILLDRTASLKQTSTNLSIQDVPSSILKKYNSVRCEFIHLGSNIGVTDTYYAIDANASTIVANYGENYRDYGFDIMLARDSNGKLRTKDNNVAYQYEYNASLRNLYRQSIISWYATERIKAPW